ncbi:succinate dehydrogenase assembly factor 2 [Candidatus Liberibacter brunswickensis]|uniref:succinate dehydrogenase assembly factor 2 n=1 Tax=Candidatus Liberibacter brunswickensis TaxID=1968796 RepID=UPI002FE092F2
MRNDVNLHCSKIIYRCWRRGTREMDLILGSFVDLFILEMSKIELDMLESIIEEDDSNLFKWITGIEKAPEHLHTPVFKRICDYYSTNCHNNENSPRNIK